MTTYRGFDIKTGKDGKFFAIRQSDFLSIFREVEPETIGFDTEDETMAAVDMQHRAELRNGKQ